MRAHAERRDRSRAVGLLEIQDGRVVVRMTLSGPTSSLNRVECPGEMPSEIIEWSSYSCDCIFDWNQVVRHGAEARIDNEGPSPLGEGTEFRLFLRVTSDTP